MAAQADELVAHGAPSVQEMRMDRSNVRGQRVWFRTKTLGRFLLCVLL